MAKGSELGAAAEALYLADQASAVLEEKLAEATLALAALEKDAWEGRRRVEQAKNQLLRLLRRGEEKEVTKR